MEEERTIVYEFPPLFLLLLLLMLLLLCIYSAKRHSYCGKFSPICKPTVDPLTATSSFPPAPSPGMMLRLMKLQQGEAEAGETNGGNYL